MGRDTAIDRIRNAKPGSAGAKAMGKLGRDVGAAYDQAAAAAEQAYAEAQDAYHDAIHAAEQAYADARAAAEDAYAEGPAPGRRPEGAERSTSTRRPRSAPSPTAIGRRVSPATTRRWRCCSRRAWASSSPRRRATAADRRARGCRGHAPDAPRPSPACAPRPSAAVGLGPTSLGDPPLGAPGPRDHARHRRGPRHQARRIRALRRPAGRPHPDLDRARHRVGHVERALLLQVVAPAPARPAHRRRRR